MALRTISVCAGVGGLDLGVRIARPDARCVAFVEARVTDDPKERQRQHVRNWRARNREKVSTDNRERHARNREANLERKRAYYQKVRKAADATPEGQWKDRDKKARRREAMQAGSLTHAEWLNIVEQHGGKCAYCARDDLPLEQDHVVALSKGGEHKADNIVPACKPCNSRKGNR